MTESPETLRIPVPEAGAEVSGLLLRPGDSRALLVLGHGAGAGMRHRFMEAMAAALAERRVATLRYQFPYMERGGGPPDRHPVLLATVRASVEAAGGRAGGLPLLAGGKSMGGRMTSMAAAEASLSGVRGLCFLGFPLHPAGRPAVQRAEHLGSVDLPMLFLQGTRDRLADLELLRPALRPLGAAVTLHVIEGADHSFAVPKRSGRTEGEVRAELAEAVAAWAGGL